MNRLRKEKRKRKMKERALLGQLGFSYRRFGELGILMMYYSFGFDFRVCTDTKFPCSVHNSLLLLLIPRFDQNLLFFFLDLWYVRVRGGLLGFC